MTERTLLVKAGVPAVIVVAVLAVVTLSGEGPALAGGALLLIGALMQAMTSASSGSAKDEVESSKAEDGWRDSFILAGWAVITFGALFSFLATLPVPEKKEPKSGPSGWWIFTNEWMLQLFSGTIGALLGAVVAAVAAVWVLNRTNAKQQDLWDATSRREELRGSMSRQIQSAADMSEGLLKLRHAIDENESSVVEASYLSTHAYTRWSADLYGLHEDFREELSLWTSGFHRDARALRNLRDYRPASQYFNEELAVMTAEFDALMSRFIDTYSRWLAEEARRKDYLHMLIQDRPGRIARKISDVLGVPTPWLKANQ